MGELNKMETKPMLPLIVTMSVPPLISMFLQYTYNFVDCMFVSWISVDADLRSAEWKLRLTAFLADTALIQFSVCSSPFSFLR